MMHYRLVFTFGNSTDVFNFTQITVAGMVAITGRSRRKEW